jgi:hypothetical protein
MGFACPVCGDPQSDARHLANHLAFTAMLRSGDHEAWLDEHVPEWGEMDEATLADRVADVAEETEYPQVFEDTTGGEGGADHDHEHGHGHGGHAGRRGGPDRGPGGYTDPSDLPAGADALAGESEDAEEVLAEARELTRKRRENADAAEDANGGSGAASEGDDAGTDDTEDA